MDDNAPWHPKQLKAGPLACWLWVCGLAYSQRHATDGFIPSEALPTLCPEAAPLAGHLVAVGLWREAEGGFQIHDFLDWNESAAERKAKQAERTARQQKWRDGRRVSSASTTASQGGDVRRGGDAAPTPPPTPTPTPPPKSGEVVPMPRYMRGPSGAHASCVTGCDYGMCLPEQLAMDLAKRLPGGFTEQGLTDTVAWANSVIEDRVARGLGMPDSSVWQFWKHRWAEQFGGSAPSFAQLRAKRAEDALGAAFNG
jgi:hypothetical protein